MKLFTAPIVMTFGEDVPASVLDAALGRLLAPGELLQRVAEAAGGYGTDAAFLPRLMTCESLRSLPLSAVRKGALALAEERLNSALRLWSLQPDEPMRRSGAFVRFIVGTRMQDPPGARDRLHELRDVSEALGQALVERFGVLASVDCWLDGNFFDGLFEGLWRYQDARLLQLCNSMSGMRDTEANATVEVHGSALQHTLRVTLHRGRDEMPVARTLWGRPAERPNVSRRCVTARLEAAGFRCRDGEAQALRGIAIPI